MGWAGFDAVLFLYMRLQWPWGLDWWMGFLFTADLVALSREPVRTRTLTARDQTTPNSSSRSSSAASQSAVDSTWNRYQLFFFRSKHGRFTPYNTFSPVADWTARGRVVGEEGEGDADIDEAVQHGGGRPPQ